MKLSVCLILKNEGQTIYRCLDSMKSFVNEYVIGIDKTTTDNTYDEVKRFMSSLGTHYEDNGVVRGNELDSEPYGIKHQNQIYFYDWSDSFAEARNAGMDKATGDFILIMDGHEYFPEKWYNITEEKELPIIQLIPKILAKIDEEQSDEAFIMLYQQPFVGQMPNNYFLQPRIYRNGIGKDGENKMRFGRAAHNVIRNTDPEKSIHFPEIILIHDAPADNRSERAKQRAEMNIKQLKEDLKKNDKDTRAYFYLGNTYMEIKEYDKAIDAFNKYLALDRPNTEEKYQVAFHLGICYKDKKEITKALDAFHRAVRITPRRRDAYILIGDVYFDEKQYQEALHHYNSALLIKPECSRMFSNGATHTWMPYQRAAYCYKELGDMQKAIAHIRRAQRYVQTPEWDEFVKECRGGKEMNVLIIDAIGSFTQPFIEYFKAKYNVVVSKRYDRYLAEWADVIWQEWADGNLMENTCPEKTLVRIHGYEAYTNMRMLQQIPWEKFKSVVFVANHIREMFPMPSLNGQVNVIQNGVDVEKFFIKNKKRPDKSVGIAGYMNVKKNPMRLAKIIKANPDYTFNLRIDWQDPFLQSSFEYEVEGCKNIVYHSRYDDLNDFWNQVQFVISTSDIESFSFNIAEAMAAGCHPIMHKWRGADIIWPADSFMVSDKICPSGMRTMQEERDYIIGNYPLNDTLIAMEQELLK
jgi:tetratricopeptide (TPR) repeat protein